MLSVWYLLISVTLIALPVGLAIFAWRVWRNDANPAIRDPIVIGWWGNFWWGRFVVRRVVLNCAVVNASWVIAGVVVMADGGMRGGEMTPVIALVVLVGMLCLLVGVPLVFVFNRPRWIVPPHLRHHGFIISDLVAEWRRRSGRRAAGTPDYGYDEPPPSEVTDVP